MFFLVVIVFVLVINFVWYLISDAWIRKNLSGYPKAQKLSRWTLVLIMVSVFVPIISMVTNFGNPLEYGPWIWAAFFYLWLGTILFWMLGMLFLGLPVWGIFKVRKRFRDRKLLLTEGQELENANLMLTRRQLLRLGLVAVPPLIAGGGAVASWVGMDNLKVYSLDLPVRDLPSDLHGFTITHLSDIHYGLLTGQERVERILYEANKLKSDLMVITGDLIDRELKYASEMVETLSQLKAPLGVHVCIGNHDKIEDVNQWVSFIRQTGMNLLLNGAKSIETGGTPIKLLGIDYAREEYLNGRSYRGRTIKAG